MPIHAFLDIPDDPLLDQPLRGVPIGLWPLRATLLHQGPGMIAVRSTRRDIRVWAKALGVRLVTKAPVASTRLNPRRTFLPSTPIDGSGPRLDPAGIQLTRLECDSTRALEIIRAVAAGLPPDHPCVEGWTVLLNPHFAHIRAIVSDVDGTLTDGGISFDDNQHAGRRFHTHDGLGTHLLHQAGIKVAWLSATSSATSIKKRADMLDVDLVDAAKGDKGPRFLKVCARLDVTPADTAYLGDDVNDLPAIGLARLSACPADARPEVRAACNIVLHTPGGHGAFRELADLVLAARPRSRGR